MTHLELSNLASDYVDGALDQLRRAGVEAHLASCAECRQLVEDVRFAVATCRSAEEQEPTPWLVSRILSATTGERKPGLASRLRAWLRPIWRPQVAYGVSMAVFSLSFVLFAARVNLRGVRIETVNPAGWFHKADSRGHLLVARAEKFYYDLRFVYDIQSVLRELHQQPGPAPAKHPGLRGPGGSSRAHLPGGVALASVGVLPKEEHGRAGFQPRRLRAEAGAPLDPGAPWLQGLKPADQLANFGGVKTQCCSVKERRPFALYQGPDLSGPKLNRENNGFSRWLRG